MVQQRRWATGLLEILFNKQSPLIGMFCRKIRFRQSLAYLYVFSWGLRSIPELFYCLLPAYCLLHNSALFPKVTLFLLCYDTKTTKQEPLDYMSLGLSLTIS